MNDLYGGLQGSESLLGLGDSSRAYQLAANRGEKRITATQKRVHELVKLDPTHPLAAVVTMLGAREEYLTRKDLDELRGKDRKGELSKKRIAEFEKTLMIFETPVIVFEKTLKTLKRLCQVSKDCAGIENTRDLITERD